MVKCTCSQWARKVGKITQNSHARQAKDQDLQFILEWLQSSAMPRQGDLFIASPAEKAYWLDKERFCLIEGVLYKEAESGDKKLVVPDSLKELAVKGSHDLPSSGHQGIARTKERLKEKFVWFGMGSYTAKYVIGCEVQTQEDNQAWKVSSY